MAHATRSRRATAETRLALAACSAGGQTDFTCPPFQRKLARFLASHLPAGCDIMSDTKSDSKADSKSGASTEWIALEQKVSELLELCAVLSRENRALRAQQQNWTTERAKLIEKNELAKSRVESMIIRLKALEQD